MLRLLLSCKSRDEFFLLVDASDLQGAESSEMTKKILIAVGVLVLVLIAAFVTALYVYPKPQIASATNQLAPDFTLHNADGENFTLSSQRGHKVVLYFYRGYW